MGLALTCRLVALRLGPWRPNPPEQTQTQKFELSGYPNPSNNQFTLKLESSNTRDEISLRIVDLYGRTIQTVKHIKAGQILQLGSEYRPGVYYVEMLQAGKKKQLKLIKQPD